MISEVLPDHLGNDRVAVKDSADSVELLGSWMVYGCDRQGHLSVLFFAHFRVTPFFALVVFFGKGNQLITTREEFCPPWNALFLYLYQFITHFWMGTN